MARSRNIKPGFFTNDDLGELDPLARLLFAGLWCHADREGRLEDRPRKFKAEILPYDDCDVNDLLNQLQKKDFLLRYFIGNKKYIQILNFKKHQNPHIKEAASIIPAPEEYGAGIRQEQVREQPKPERAGLIPDSLNLIPDSFNPIPDSLHSNAPEKKSGAAKLKSETPLQVACRQTWLAYAKAYQARYSVEPVINAKVRSQIKMFVERIGYVDSPAVAAYFVESNAQFFVMKGHPVGLLLADAEKLRTEWVTGRKMTATRAQQIDKTQTNANAVDEAMLLLGNHDAKIA